VGRVTTSGTRGSGDVTEVVLGVDTHLDFHVAVVLDPMGRRLGEIKVPTTAKGYGELLRWAKGFGPVRCVGVEGTGSYGTGLTRHLKAAGILVVEVERPKRRHLRRRSKADPIDAETAARAVLGGETAGVPKSSDGRVEMLRTLRSARRSAVKALVQAANLLKAMLVTAPEELRRRLRGLSTKELVAVAARFRLGGDPKDVGAATSFALLNLLFSLTCCTGRWTRATRTYSLERRLTVPLQSTIVAIHFNKLPLVTTPMSLPSPEGFIGKGRNGAQTQSPTGRSDVKRTMVRYKVKPEQAAHNEELLRRVYEELQRTAPEGLRYATFASEDGVSFVHVASIETGDGSSPLADVAAFRAFQKNIGARCDEPPVAIDLREIGSYGFWGGGMGA
jgi:hypothetical protein